MLSLYSLYLNFSGHENLIQGTLQSGCHPDNGLGRTTHRAWWDMLKTQKLKGKFLYNYFLMLSYFSLKHFPTEEELGERYTYFFSILRRITHLHIYESVSQRCVLCHSLSHLQLSYLYDNIVIQVGVQFYFLKWKHHTALFSFCFLGLRCLVSLRCFTITVSFPFLFYSFEERRHHLWWGRLNFFI